MTIIPLRKVDWIYAFARQIEVPIWYRRLQLALIALTCLVCFLTGLVWGS